MVTSGSASSGGSQYQPVDCPGGGKALCDALNALGVAWEDWGKQVKNVIDAMGPPTGVSPPPPPPFK